MGRARFSARSLLQLGCILALLFSQQLALAHAVWHAHQQLPSHQNEQTDADSGPDTYGAEIACAFHAAFGQVLGAAPFGHPACFEQPSGVETSRGLAEASAPSYFLAPLSRGPPALL